MPTDIINSIGATGRDYSTIAAWESASPVTGSSATGQGLVAADERWIGEMYDDASPSFTENITITGATTDSTRYRILRAAAGEAYDHVTDTGVIIRPANEFGTHSVDTAENAVHLGWPGRGFCVKGKSVADERGGKVDFRSPSGRLDSIVARNACLGTNGCFYCDFPGANAIWRNLVVIDCDLTNALRVDFGVKVLNCSGFDTGAFNKTSRTTAAIFINCVNLSPKSGSCFVSDGGSAWGTGTNNNCSSDLTAPGTNAIHSATAANNYVSTTAGSEDLHVKDAAADIYEAGATDTDAGADLDGTSRPQNTAYEIGAFEFVASGNTYDDTGAGGVTIGGAGEVSVECSQLGSGGAICGGAGPIQGTYSQAGSGGALAGGAGDVQATYSIAGDGQVTIGGAGLIGSSTFDETGSGGVIVGGAGDVSAAYTLAGSGGAILAGSGDVQYVGNQLGSGSVTIGGSGDVSAEYSITGVGGVLLAGDGLVQVTGTLFFTCASVTLEDAYDGTVTLEDAYDAELALEDAYDGTVELQAC